MPTSNEHDLMTRRAFLRTGILGGALASSIPGFLQTTLTHIEAAETNSPLQRPHGKDAPILIVMQLAGGNDGLNTIVPLNNDYYRKARPQLSKLAAEALKANDKFGFHPSLTGMKALYDDGLLGVVHGVGYPNPNRSHFRSTEIWHTGIAKERELETGWLGRYFDATCKGEDPESGVSLTSNTPLAFANESQLGVTFRNPKQFRFADTSEELMQEMMVGEDAAPKAVDPLAFLERSNLDAHVASENIHEVINKFDAPKNFPDSKIGSELKLISQLIGGGLSTRVFYLSQGGYDTHANQAETHARLLKELGDSLHAFWKELKKQGNQKRVCMLIFSEFGRRVAENASAGTDHGAAAPMYVLGDGINAGFHGTFPSLAPADLFRGDIQHTTDFRQVYATVLEKHLSTRAKPILGADYTQVKLF